MQKPRIQLSGNKDRYEVIIKTSMALKENGIDYIKFFEEIYLDSDYKELLELAKQYVEIIEKPIVEFDSKGPSGNIYHILGLVQHALKKQHRITDYNTLRERVFDSKSYADALAIVREYVNLVDIRGID